MRHDHLGGERARAIDQDQIPGAVDQPVPLIGILVADEVVEHLGAEQLPVPPARVRRWRRRHATQLLPGRSRDPIDGRAKLAPHAALHGRRRHVELQQLVELIGGDLGLVALEKALIDSRLDVLLGEGVDAPTGSQLGSLGSGHPGADVAKVRDLSGSQVLLDCWGVARPCLGAARRRGTRGGGVVLGPRHRRHRHRAQPDEQSCQRRSSAYHDVPPYLEKRQVHSKRTPSILLIRVHGQTEQILAHKKCRSRPAGGFFGYSAFR